MKANPGWWKKFYTGIWQEIQPALHTSGQTREEADFIEDVLNLRPRYKILDVPCGEGRLSVELASRGYMMCGVDLNKNFLKIAKAKANRRNLNIIWFQKDMRKIQWRGKFDAAICMWASFGYFDEEGNIEFLKAISRSLKGGGRFLLDTPVAETLYPKFLARGRFKAGNIDVAVARSFDYVTGRNEEKFTFVQGGRHKIYRSSIRIYTYREIIDILRKKGFGHFKAYGSFSKHPFQLGASRLLIAARKL